MFRLLLKCRTQPPAKHWPWKLGRELGVHLVPVAPHPRCGAALHALTGRAQHAPSCAATVPAPQAASSALPCPAMQIIDSWVPAHSTQSCKAALEALLRRARGRRAARALPCSPYAGRALPCSHMGTGIPRVLRECPGPRGSTAPSYPSTLTSAQALRPGALLRAALPLPAGKTCATRTSFPPPSLPCA